jgi:hypothetical protein
VKGAGTMRALTKEQKILFYIFGGILLCLPIIILIVSRPHEVALNMQFFEGGAVLIFTVIFLCAYTLPWLFKNNPMPDNWWNTLLIVLAIVATIAAHIAYLIFMVAIVAVQQLEHIDMVFWFVIMLAGLAWVEWSFWIATMKK